MKPASLLLLLALTALLAFAVLALTTPISQASRDDRDSRNIWLLAIGLVAVARAVLPRRWETPREALHGVPHETRTARSDALFWLALLLPAYAALQLLPLPLAFLRILSPSRRESLDALARLGLEPRFAPLSVIPPATLTHLLLVCAYAAIFLLIRDIARSSRATPWVPVLPLLGVAAWQASWGVSQSLAESGDNWAHGNYPIRNHYAGLLEMLLPLALAYGAKGLRARGRGDHISPAGALQIVVGFGIAALTLAGLVNSLSRMGLISAAASLTLMGMLALARVRGKKKWPAIVSAAIAVALIAILVAPAQLVLRFVTIAGEGRFPVWRDTLHVIAAYPAFGCGLGGYESVVEKFKTTNFALVQDYAHNDYLQFLAELGLIGFLMAGAVVTLIVGRVVRAGLQNRDNDHRWLGLGCAGALAAILIHSAADFNLYVPANAAVLAWICGIAASV